jgi:tight adherence protein B
MTHLLLPFLAGSAASFAALMVLLRPDGASSNTARRLQSIQKPAGIGSGSRSNTALEKEDPWGYMEWLEKLLERHRRGQALKTLLLHSDSRLSMGAFVLVSASLGAVASLGVWLFQRTILMSAVALIVAATIPMIVLRMKRNRRLKAFNAALPDAIDLMSRCLAAGHSVGSSIEMMGQQSPEPLAFEFVQIFQQQRLGMQFRDALLQMGNRVPSRDLQFFITAILVQKETGGDLTEILTRTSHVIRERVRIEGEVRTRTAQGRMTGWILALLPVVMLVLINIISPGYSTVLFHDPVGKDLMYAGATMIAIGALIIRQIVNVQV